MSLFLDISKLKALIQRRTHKHIQMHLTLLSSSQRFKYLQSKDVEGDIMAIFSDLFLNEVTVIEFLTCRTKEVYTFYQFFRVLGYVNYEPITRITNGGLTVDIPTSKTSWILRKGLNKSPTWMRELRTFCDSWRMSRYPYAVRVS